MSIVELAFAPSSDPRLAAQLADHATSPSPVWLWSADGSHIVWTNAVGAAVFGAADTCESAERLFEPDHPAALEIARLAATLPASGQARLERLRGFGASFGGALTCICSLVPIADDAFAVLVVGTEAAGLPLTLRERVHRLFAGRESALAVFALDGTLLFATNEGRARLGETPTSSALGIAELAAQALTSGRASGVTRYGAITIERLGVDSSAVLAVTFGAEPLEHELEPQRSDAVSQHWPSPELPAAAIPESSSHESDERRHPLRFVWQMDAEGHFVIGSDEFTELVGPRTTAAFGRLWSEIAAELKVDPEDRIAHAVATHETWSGIVLSWPVEEGNEWLPVEFAGLPVFDSAREFCGYRGFGICRDVARINQLLRARREPPVLLKMPEIAPEVAAIPAEEVQTPALTQTKAVAGGSAGVEDVAEADLAASPALSRLVPLSANVVPFPHSTATSDAIAAAAVEPKAFNELAQELRARLREHADLSVADGGDSPAGDAASEAARRVETPEPQEAHRDPQTELKSAEAAKRHALAAIEPMLLDHIPAGVLIYQRDTLVHANRHFLELSGYASIEELAAAGGLNSLFAEPVGGPGHAANGGPPLAVVTRGGVRLPVRGHLCTVPWREVPALALILTESETDAARKAAAPSPGFDDARISELNAKLDSLASQEDELLRGTPEAQLTARQFGFARQDEPRNSRAAQHHYRLQRNHAGRAFWCDRPRALPRLFARHLRSRTAYRFRAERSFGSVQGRDRPIRSRLRRCRSQRRHPAVRERHAAASKPCADHYPNVARAAARRSGRRRARSTPNPAQSSFSRHQADWPRRPSDCIDGPESSRRRSLACARHGHRHECERTASGAANVGTDAGSG